MLYNDTLSIVSAAVHRSCGYDGPKSGNNINNNSTCSETIRKTFNDRRRRRHRNSDKLLFHIPAASYSMRVA